jgi:cytochrome c2
MYARLFMTLAAIGCATAGTAQAQDPVAGAAVYKTQCGACHSPEEGKNLLGPSLFGIVGRAAGQVPGFHYSPANKDSGLIWDAPTLNRYLISPKDVVPKTTMPYGGLKDDQKRADLIAYMTTLH